MLILSAALIVAAFAYPTQVFVDKRGVVRWTFQTANYRVRAKPEAIFAAIDKLAR